MRTIIVTGLFAFSVALSLSACGQQTAGRYYGQAYGSTTPQEQQPQTYSRRRNYDTPPYQGGNPNAN